VPCCRTAAKQSRGDEQGRAEAATAAHRDGGYRRGGDVTAGRHKWTTTGGGG